MAHESNSATLQVAGLARSVNESLLLNMFRTYGPILRVKVDGFGGAHVVFERKANAYKAIPATNGAVLEGKPILVTMVPRFTNTKKTCRGFVAGICRKGAACKYMHLVENGEGAAVQPARIPKVKQHASPASVSAPAPSPEVSVNAAIPAQLHGLPGSLVCRHFARGHCSLGASCRFAHIRGVTTAAALRAPQAPAQMQTPDVLPQQAPVAPVASVAAPVSKKRAAPVSPAVAPVVAKRPCQFFASGLCKRGEQCAYSHDLPTPAPPAKKEKKAKSTTAPVATKTPAPAVAAVPSNTQQEEDSSRTCIECETPDIAVWQCARCDDALYCESCNTLVHKSKVMKSHERTKLAPMAPKIEIKNPTCDECEETESSVKCDQCDVVLCADCDASVHKFKSLRSHTRTAIVKPTTTTTSSAPVAVAVAKPAVVVQKEPALKKQKVSKTQAIASPVAASMPVVPKIAYIESVPKYDLTSASESESSESEAEEQQEDEDETMDSGDDDELPIIVNTFPPQSVANVAPKQQQKVAPAPAPTQAPPTPQAQNGDISSESSDDDDNDERPVVLAAPVRKVPVKSVAAAAAATSTVANPHEVSSESESSSDDDDDETEPEQSAPVAASKPAAPSADSSSSSEDEASSSSDDEEEAGKQVVKAPVVKKAPVAPVARAPPAPKANQNRGSVNPGISTGSSHSLVKKIEAYSESSETETLHLDANLNGFERLLAHDCAERLGLKHLSIGEGLERHITICRR